MGRESQSSTGVLEIVDRRTADHGTQPCRRRGAQKPRPRKNGAARHSPLSEARGGQRYLTSHCRGLPRPDVMLQDIAAREAARCPRRRRRYVRWRLMARDVRAECIQQLRSRTRPGRLGHNERCQDGSHAADATNSIRVSRGFMMNTRSGKGNSNAAPALAGDKLYPSASRVITTRGAGCRGPGIGP